MRPYPSLRQLLLRWLAPAVVLLLGASAITGYLVAVRVATQAYDRALLDGALSLSQLVRAQDGDLFLDLQPQAMQVLTTDKYDRVFFSVFGPDGRVLGGSQALTPPPGWTAEPDRSESWSYHDHRFDGHRVRLAVLQSNATGKSLTIVMAETMTKRDRLVREVLTSILVPEIVLVAATLLIIVAGIRHGLGPLRGLREQLARRSHTDLRPLDVNRLPQEVQPLADEINNLLARLEVSLGAQRHFVADAAHQLRTPIAALQAQIEALIQEDGGTARTAAMSRVLAGIRRLAHLVHQLLALARAEPGRSNDAEPADLAEIIRDNADRWLPQAIERNVDLGFELAPAQVPGVPLLLTEMLTNIVENAIRYTPAGGSVTVRCGTTESDIRVEVDDSGPGIPAKERERVFERFVRLDEGNVEGCGLGLAIVRLIARQHGAEAEISDSPQGGARVTVRFVKD